MILLTYNVVTGANQPIIVAQKPLLLMVEESEFVPTQPIKCWQHDIETLCRSPTKRKLYAA